MTKKLLIYAGLVTAGWLLWREYTKAAQGESYLIDGGLLDNLTDFSGYTVGKINDGLEGVLMSAGFSSSRAKNVKSWMLADNNVKAFLQVIRKGEGTSGVNGYRTLFGGTLFTSFADHPRIYIKRGSLTSSAAGAYQFLAKTWDETAALMGLRDFSPASQDLAALGRIAIRGALDDVLAGRFETAIKKTAKEWASLPFSPYGQPTQSLEGARLVYVQNGGIEAA